MTSGEKKRQRLFDKYTSNLNLLIDNNLIEAKKNSYICPICLGVHEVVESDDNPLTLEDAPPKSLGGKANTLTCQDCNGHCGRQIDHHLTIRMRELDSAKFKPNTSTRVLVDFDGVIIRSKLTVESDGKMLMEHSRKNNDPKVLDPIMEKLKGGKKISMNFFKSRVIPEKLEFALLKTGYMLAFEKLGYSLMLNNCFDDVRSQILNPDKRIFTDAFWAKQAYPKEYCGVYFVMDKGCECIITIFQLDTGVSKETFCVFLPTPVRNIEEAISNIKTKEGDADQLMLELYPSPESSVDYLFDIQNIMAMNDWLNKRAEKI